MLRAAMASALFFAVFAWNRLRSQPQNSTHPSYGSREFIRPNARFSLLTTRDRTRFGTARPSHNKTHRDDCVQRPLVSRRYKVVQLFHLVTALPRGIEQEQTEETEDRAFSVISVSSCSNQINRLA
jgi:hypothetical protein